MAIGVNKASYSLAISRVVTILKNVFHLQSCSWDVLLFD